MFQSYPRASTEGSMEDETGKKFEVRLSKRGKKNLGTKFPLNLIGFGAGLTDKVMKFILH